jgi:hypothetical protein
MSAKVSKTWLLANSANCSMVAPSKGSREGVDYIRVTACARVVAS